MMEIERKKLDRFLEKSGATGLKSLFDKSEKVEVPIELAKLIDNDKDAVLYAVGGDENENRWLKGFEEIKQEVKETTGTDCHIVRTKIKQQDIYFIVF